MQADKTQLGQLVSRLAGALVDGIPSPDIQLLHTHISIVLLLGDTAYKFKKPVNLGFLDFSTLEKRRFFCEEEVRLNRRYSPELYLGVVAVTGTPDKPELDGQGPVLEYCVKMRRFNGDHGMDRELAGGRLDEAMIVTLAERIAGYHLDSVGTGPVSGGAYGGPAQIHADTLQNLEELGTWVEPESDRRGLARLQDWLNSFFDRHRSVFEDRGRNGFIRECHGDLHLGNIVRIGNLPMLFDCIEFRASWRMIDVINEVAFLAMDLDARGGSGLSTVFLNRYMELTGDYAGMVLLPYYYIYRALVRYKVGLIQQRNSALAPGTATVLTPCPHRYLEIAEKRSRPCTPVLYITHGFSGSGKTAITRRILPATGCIRVRSDIERKRLHGLRPVEDAGAIPGAGIYTTDETQRTYQHLLQCTDDLLQAGYSVIVDATFLDRILRVRFSELAAVHHCRFVILDFRATKSQLHARIRLRSRHGGDASDADSAVLENQFKHHDPLTPAELEAVVPVETGGEPVEVIADKVISRLQKGRGQLRPVST